MVFLDETFELLPALCLQSYLFFLLFELLHFIEKFRLCEEVLVVFFLIFHAVDEFMCFGGLGVGVGGGREKIIGDIIKLKIGAHDIGDKFVEFSPAFEEVLEFIFVEEGF